MEGPVVKLLAEIYHEPSAATLSLIGIFWLTVDESAFSGLRGQQQKRRHLRSERPKMAAGGLNRVLGCCFSHDWIFVYDFQKENIC
jgi:hypothetical protein